MLMKPPQSYLYSTSRRPRKHNAVRTDVYAGAAVSRWEKRCDRTELQRFGKNWKASSPGGRPGFLLARITIPLIVPSVPTEVLQEKRIKSGDYL